jgi:Protein kinase domain
MSVDNNKVHKKNYSFPGIENGLEESLDMLPLLPYRLDNDDVVGKNKNKTIEKILTVTEIVDLIINTSQSIQLRYTNRNELVKIISNLHNQNSSSCVFNNNDFIIFKKYDEYGEGEGEDGANKSSGGSEKYNKNCEITKNYGVFKHKCLDFIFRIDSVDGQVEYEDKISRILLNKYNNNYKDVVQMGIVLPMYVHIQNSSKSQPRSQSQSQSHYFPLYYSVQPYINGITLDCWMELNKRKSNIVEIVYDLFIQLCAIIKELHELDCVHGDLKPSNIMIMTKNSQNCVFLIDFGLSGIHLKTKHASGGTLPYCAPETENTCALNAHNRRNENNAVFNAKEYTYNWTIHNKSHDIWSIGLIFMSIYVFNKTYHYYKDYPYDFFNNSGYIPLKYFQLIKHEYIREVLNKHVLVEPARRCDIHKLSELLSNLAFM